MADEAERYWKEFERETGEQMRTRSMGQWMEDGVSAGRWGILVITDRSFRYRYLPSESWMTSLFKRQSDPSVASKSAEIAVPLENIMSVTEPPRGLFSFLSGSGYVDFRIVCRSAAGGTDSTEREYRFSGDRQFVAALRKAIPAPTSLPG